MSIRPVDLSGMIQRTQDIGNIKHAEDSRPVADQYNIEVRQEKQESDLSQSTGSGTEGQSGIPIRCPGKRE